MAPYALTTPRLVITPRQGPKQAWGGALEAFKECGLPAGAKMRNLALGFTLPERGGSEKYDIAAIMHTIQQYVFQRRLRVKDSFRDYDALRCGRCTRQQFMRGVNTTIPSLRKDELEALADYYTEEGPHVQIPQVLDYVRFVAAVEEVFTVAHLEKQPTRQVLRAGSSLQRGFTPVSSGQTEDSLVQDLLLKIALLCKTRGLIFLSCFQDCDRSDAISLVTPRYSGKATPAQFRQHFPLIRDFDESEIKLLSKRYTGPSGDINYQALDMDIKAAAELVPPPSGEHAPMNRVPQSARSQVSGARVSSERCRRQAALMETRQSVDIMERLRAIVQERRLRLADCFVDFDKLRKGLCTMNQLKTVFTVLGIELNCGDYAALGELFSNEEICVRGHVPVFRYREFCDQVCDVHALNINSWDMDLPPTPSTAGMERPGSRIRYKAPLGENVQDRLYELEIWIRNRAEVRSLDLKRCFQDFDKVCTGHVTRTQFTRIMLMMQCELSTADCDMLCQAFCDTDSGLEFNYIDFCNSIKQRDQVDRNNRATSPSSRKPKYFDRSGDCISPWSPIDMGGWGSPEPSSMNVGGVCFSR